MRNLTKNNFSYNFSQCIKSFKKICDMYGHSLINDIYLDTVNDDYREQLDIYKKNMDRITQYVHQPELWKSVDDKKEASHLMATIKRDNRRILDMSEKRLECYEYYKDYRDSIIRDLYIRYNTTANIAMFDYFVQACDTMDMFDCSEESEYKNKINNRQITIDDNDYSMLYQWFVDNKETTLASIVEQFPDATEQDMTTMFELYNDYRVAAYKIFNTVTINIKYLAKKLKNIPMKYCRNKISKEWLVKLYKEALRMDSTYEHELIDFNKLVYGDISEVDTVDALNEAGFYDMLWPAKERDKKLINSVKMVSRDASACKILSDGVSVYANTIFHPGDIIEICPARQVDKTSLYSRDMRDIVFEVVQNEVYVIPFGYCQYYDIADEKHPANCEYEWNPDKRTIIISASQRIPKNQKLYLQL